MFDITKLASADTAAIHLKNADGELIEADGAPVRIIVHGPGSRAYGIVEARQTARVHKNMAENDGKYVAPPHEVRVAQAAEDLAAITVRFENLGYPPAGDAEGAELFAALYADQKLGFITKQVTKFVADWGNFKAGSAVS